MVDGPKIFKLLEDISFESGSENVVSQSLLLFSCSCYYVDLDDIQWNEVATSTASNFNNSRPLYLNFSNMINLCLNIWFIENSKCQQFLFWRKNRHKKHKFFMFLSGRYFAMGGPIDANVDMFWDTSVGFLKYVVLQLFPKYSQSYVNLNVKKESKIQLPLKSRRVVLVFSIWM